MDRASILRAEEEAPARQKVTPDPEGPHVSASGLITTLIVVHVLFGIVCIVAGLALGVDAYSDGAFYIMGGILAGVFEFTMAVVTAACKKIIFFFK